MMLKLITDCVAHDCVFKVHKRDVDFNLLKLNNCVAYYASAQDNNNLILTVERRNLHKNYNFYDLPEMMQNEN